MLGWSNICKSVIKALENSETQGIYLNIINAIHNKANSTSMEKTFLTRQGYPLSTPAFSIELTP